MAKRRSVTGQKAGHEPELRPREKKRAIHSGTRLNEVEFNARVARKAFELFERRGGDSGRDVEDWLEAERLVNEEIRKESQS
ncbi:MAG: DUF2934 domain-containing protein [Nitrospiraceae bacterium]